MDPSTLLTKETHFSGSPRSKIPPSPTVPGNPSKPGTEVANITEAETLELLYTQPDDNKREERLARLGYRSKLSTRIRTTVFNTHQSIALLFNEESEIQSCDKVLERLMELGHQLMYLFAEGHQDRTVLHQLFDHHTYESSKIALDRLKPLVRFLLKIIPELPGIPDCFDQVPLYLVMKFPSKEIAEKIVRYLCGSKANGGLDSEEAVKSLSIRKYKKSNFPTMRNHALHKAIQKSIIVDEEIVEKVKTIRTVPTDPRGDESKTCLEEWDSTGKTCLHLALTSPFTTAKCRWAKMLIKLKPDLLKIGLGTVSTTKLDTLTPFQHYNEEKRKAIEGKENTDGGPRSLKDKRSDKAKPDLREEPDLKDLEHSLKLCCLKSFDNVTAKTIMYKRDQSQCICRSTHILGGC